MSNKTAALTLEELQKRLTSFYELKAKLSEKQKMIKKVEDALKKRSEFLSKEMLRLKLPKLEVKNVGVFTPTEKTNYFYPSAGNQDDRTKFIKWVNTHMGPCHSDKLLAMTYQTVTSLVKGAIENKWIAKDKMPPGITFKKTSHSLSIRKK